MAQKNASPTRAQARILEKHSLNKLMWSVMRELENVLIIRHKITGEVKVIEK